MDTKFAYKITYYLGANPSTNNAKTAWGYFDIKFLTDTTDATIAGLTAVRTNTANTDYVVHPAFTSAISLGGTSEVTGFWIGKFEASNPASVKDNENYTPAIALAEASLLNGITMRPNVTSWGKIAAADIFTLCRNMNDTNNIHGFVRVAGSGQTAIDTMMMKNSQWGAVAYLTQSDWGNKQTDNNLAPNPQTGIWNNAYYEQLSYLDGATTKTKNVVLSGMVGSNRYDYNATALIGKTYVVNENDMHTGEITLGAKTYYRYYTTQGQKGSTTNNIYGVYDMSGGLSEYVASYTNYEISSAVATMNGYDAKYRQPYIITEANTKVANYAANSNMYGDAVYETSTGGADANSFCSSWSEFVYNGWPFFARGSTYAQYLYTGIFCYHRYNGFANASYGFRVVAI